MNELTDYERAVLRAYHRATTAPWWKRALWGRDVFHPRLGRWRAIRALFLAWAVLVAVLVAAVPYPQPWTRIGLFVWAGIGLAAIAERWRALR